MENVKKILAGATVIAVAATNQTAFALMDAGSVAGAAGTSAADYDTYSDTDVSADVPGDSSADWTKPVTGDATVSMMDTVENDIVVEGGSLTLDVNADLSKYKIILKNAKSLTLGVNAKVGTVEGTVANIDFGTNSEVDVLNVRVTEKAVLQTNSKIGTVHLAAKALDMDVNTEIAGGNIYVFDDLAGSVNTKFDGKLTVHRDTALDVNAEVGGRFCSLGRVDLGVNSSVNTYEIGGLLGNVDPVLDVSMDDDSETYGSVAELAKEFDKDFAAVMDKIDAHNATIASLKSKKAAAKEEDKAAIQGQIDAEVSTKSATKSAFVSKIDDVFATIEPYVDADEKAQALFAKTKVMYVNAVEKEDAGSVYNVCSNSQVFGDVNSVYEKGGKVYFGKNSFKRVARMKKSQEASIEKILGKMNDDKLESLGAKVNVLIEKTASKKSLSKKDTDTANLLMDLRELIRNEYLY